LLTIKNKIKARVQEPFDTSYLNSLNRFSKLYISKTGNKEIKGQGWQRYQLPHAGTGSL